MGVVPTFVVSHCDIEGVDDCGIVGLMGPVCVVWCTPAVRRIVLQCKQVPLTLFEPVFVGIIFDDVMVLYVSLPDAVPPISPPFMCSFCVFRIDDRTLDALLFDPLLEDERPNDVDNEDAGDCVCVCDDVICAPLPGVDFSDGRPIASPR